MSWNLLQYFPHQRVAVSLIRYDDGTVDEEGKWVKGSSTINPHFIIVPPQPVTGDDLKMLPEGEEASSFLSSYSEMEVFTRKGQRDADEIIWHDEMYKVHQVEERVTGGYFHFIMRKIEWQQ